MATTYLRKNTYWISYFKDGKRYQYSTRFKNKRDATYLKNKIELELAEGRSPILRYESFFYFVYDEFVKHCKVSCQPRTVRYYEEILNPFKRWLPTEIKINNITPQMIVNYINSKDVAIGMRWHIIKTLVTFFNFTVKSKLLHESPVKISKPKLPKREPECWTNEERKRILESIEHELIKKMIQANLYMGLRPAELTRLQWSDVDLEERVLTVGEAKDGEFRRIPLHSEAVKIFKSIKHAGPEIFPFKDKFLRAQSKEIRTKSQTTRLKRFWYSTRHTFATEYCKKTGDLKGLQEILGHSKIEMTMVYVNPQADHQKKQLEKLSYV